MSQFNVILQPIVADVGFSANLAAKIARPMQQNVGF